MANPVPWYKPEFRPMLQENVACSLGRVDAYAVCFKRKRDKSRIVSALAEKKKIVKLVEKFFANRSHAAIHAY